MQHTTHPAGTVLQPHCSSPYASQACGGSTSGPLSISPLRKQASSGGIAGWRGWLGLGLSLCSMASTILYFCSLQAFRGLGFTSAQLQVCLCVCGRQGCLMQGDKGQMRRAAQCFARYLRGTHAPASHLPPPVQYCYLVFCALLLLPLTLPIDGTDWSGQFGEWSASSWAMLVLVSSVVCIGANYCLQVESSGGLGGGGEGSLHARGRRGFGGEDGLWALLSCQLRAAARNGGRA